MYKERIRHEQVNEPEYERRLAQAVRELKNTMNEVAGYAARQCAQYAEGIM